MLDLILTKVCQASRPVGQCALEFAVVDCATLVLINRIEHSSQFVKSALRHLLDEKLNGCLPQLTTSMESSQAGHYGLLHTLVNVGRCVRVLEPVMLHGVDGGNSFGRVLLEHRSDQILQVSTELLWHFEVLLSDSSEQVSLIICYKRQLTGHHEIKHNTEGPNVALFAVVFNDDFRSNIIWCSSELFRALAHLAGESKINKLDSATWLIKHNILRLDVSMN